MPPKMSKGKLQWKRQKGMKRPVVDGWDFYFHKKLVNEVDRYSCSIKGCKAFIKLNERKVMIEQKLVHNHSSTLSSARDRIKRRRVRRGSKLGGRGATLPDNIRRNKRPRSGPSTPTASPVKNGQPPYPCNAEDIKNTVSYYFGAVNRIASGEKFTIRARRILPNGKTQYLIDWGCSPT